jgi:Flp pilus assembly protein TadD
MSVRKAKYATPIVLAMLLAGFAAHAEDKSDSATQIDRAYKDAVEQRLEGDLQGAASTLGQLVLVTPDDPRILAEYGKVLAAQGRADDALAFLRRSAQLQPNDWTVYSAMGIAFDQKANYKSAKIAYDRALMLKPGDPSVLSNAGVSRMLAGDLDGAEQMLAQASVEGKDPKIATNLALVRSLKTSAPQVASAAKAAPVKQASLAPAAPVVAAKPAPAPAPVAANMPAPAPVAASKPAPATAQVVSNTPAPAKPMAKNTYEALKNDPTVRMAPIPREEVAAKPAPAPHVAAVTPAPKAPAPAPVKAAEAKPAPQATPAAPHVLLQAPATKVAAKPAPTPVATAAPQPLVKNGALKAEKSAAKETPKPAAAKAPAPVKAAANPAAAKTPAPMKAAAAAAPAAPAPAKPVVITGKPKTPPVETAMLRPTVTDVTPVAATAHKNTAPQGD